MEYKLQRHNEHIVAIDSNNQSIDINEVFDFSLNQLLFFLEECDGKYNVIGHFDSNTNTKTIYDEQNGKEKECCVIDSNGRIIYEGNIDPLDISIENRYNSWLLISTFPSMNHGNLAMLFDRGGLCIRYFEDVHIYNSNKRKEFVVFEGALKRFDCIYGNNRSQHVYYRADFENRLIYECEEIPNCNSRHPYLRKSIYYFCKIIHEGNIIKRNIVAIYPFSDSFKQIFDKNIEFVGDVYCYDYCLSVITKLEGSSNYVYTCVKIDEERSKIITQNVSFPETYKVKRLERKYANLIEKTPFVQVVDEENNRRIYFFDKMVTKGDSDFFVLHHRAYYEYVHTKGLTVIGISTRRCTAVSLCSNDKIYNIDGSIIKDFNDTPITIKNKFRILDTWENFIAGYYEGTDNYDFFALEQVDNRVTIKPADCIILNVNGQVLVSLIAERRDSEYALYKGGHSFGFDVLKNKFIILPDFKPTPEPKREDYGNDYISPLEAFEGNADLYYEWMLNS